MITIVTKLYCPFCMRAKQFLDQQGEKYTEIEVSNDQETYEKYQEISGMHTVPQIFIGEAKNENLIGGYDDLMSAYRGGKIFK